MTTGFSEAQAVTSTWTLGDRLRKARAVKGMDQREFATALEVKAGTLAGWETDRQKPRDLVDIAQKVQKLTGVSAMWILGLEAVTPQYVPRNVQILGKNRRSGPRTTICADRKDIS